MHRGEVQSRAKAAYPSFLMISADQALQIVLENVAPLGVERIPILDALGRVLAETISSPRDIPGLRQLRDGRLRGARGRRCQGVRGESGQVEGGRDCGRRPDAGASRRHRRDGSHDDRRADCRGRGRRHPGRADARRRRRRRVSRVGGASRFHPAARRGFAPRRDRRCLPARRSRRPTLGCWRR